MPSNKSHNVHLQLVSVREHFSSPLLHFAARDEDATFTLIESPSGTGQLISRLTNNEIDIALALTDALIAGIAKGSKAYKPVGSFVSTPLNWAVVTGTNSQYNSISDLQDTTIGISRYGSGSQVMAYVMASQQGWPADNLKFQVNNDIHSLIASVNDGSTSAFMWEWFTTKPFVDAGEARFIGSVPTPWPSWMIAAHPERAPQTLVTQFLAGLTSFVKDFDSEESRITKNVSFIEENWGYRRADIEAWQSTVRYTSDCTEIPSEVITNTLSFLERAGVINTEKGFQLDDFIERSIARLT